MITQARLKKILNYNPETGVFTWLPRPGHKFFRNAGQRAGSFKGGGYRKIHIGDYRHYAEHRLAWLYMTGEWPKDQIDHINRTPSDNRWANLREADKFLNAQNMSLDKRNKTGIPGVKYDNTIRSSKKYRAYIQVNGVFTHLGIFRTKRAAAYAREQAEIRFGVVKTVPLTV